MASSNHVEVEAAKFLQKLIQDSKDEPAKLATKLYVICQHMKMSGKEQSLPYQVISRAMETVISQHGLDIEVLKQARLPLTGGPLIGDSSNVRSMEKDTPDNQMQMGGRDMPFKGTPAGAWHSGSGSKAREDVYGGSSQSVAVSQDPNEMARLDSVNPSRPPVGPGRVDSSGHEFYQGSGPQRSGGLFEHESPSSLDTRSANSQERHDSAKPVKGGRKKETKKPSVKRKRGDSTSGVDSNTDNLQQPGNTNVGVSSRKGKMNKPEMRSHFSDRSGEQSHVNPVQGVGNMEQFSSVSSGRGSIFRGKQDDQISNSTLKHIEEREMPGHGSLGIQNGGPLPFGHDILNSKNVADQFKMGFPSENSQFSRFALNNSSSSMKDISNAQFAAPCGTSKENKNNAFEFPGHFEGSNAGKFGRQGDPYSAQSVGEESLGNESELGTPGRSLDTMNSHVSQGMTGLSGSIHKVHGGVPGSFNPYGMLRPGFPSPVQFNSSSFGSHDIVSKLHNGRSMEASSGVQLMGMNKDTTIFGTSQKSPLCQTQDSKHMTHEFSKGSESSISERGMGVRMGSTNQEEETLTSISAGKDLEQEGGTSDKGGNAYKMVQVSGSQGQPSRGNFDTGKVPISQALVSSGMPFREQHLKQLRAQCLVFLAFRNGLMPRKLHLEIALGGGNPKEAGNTDGAYREMNRSDETSSSLARSNDIREPERVPPGLSSTGVLVEAETSSRDTENPKKRIIKEGTPSVDSALPEEMKRFAFARSKSESEMLTQEAVESQAILASTLEPDALINNGKTLFESDDEKNDRTGSGNLVQSSIFYNGASKETSAAGIFQHESVPEEIDNSINTTGIHGDVSRANQVYKPEFPAIQVSQCTEKILSDFSLKEQTKPISGGDDAHSRDVLLEESTISNSCGDTFAAGGSRSLDDQRVFETQKQWNMDQFQIVNPDEASNHGNSLMDLEILTEEEESMSTDKLPSPEYSTSEKWIMDYQKRKILEEQNWEMKQKKTEERIAVCFNKLKETVSSSENTSSKTKSVIELKKLQLLHLQRRLRSGFLHDFFKPISPDMERLKSIKKHRHGRRVKQLEKYEQKMKEERLKRIRERQKEFFSEIEAHKERLEDGFKIKRERWKSFNKYVKEFHKRKERIHREKLDRIQREKINLLKNNDVEGYLRMVQDAKSDRVKQLLKETEKYLQKLGSKLQEAKSMARQFEMEMDENRATNVVEKSEIPVLNEDENDQAEHYLESNEKYYLMAHSIKESIAEQPTSLLGGKLREYQMNGLRWLVSLYNNHLNGILADEMGLGKTVQVIALICYLMEAKNDRGPFLVVVPSSVLSGWVSEINFWAPGINKIAYTGPPEERRRLFKERIIPQKFNVLVTTYEYLMNKHDRPKLSKVHWHYIIIDEGHRIKNASCKLNADLKHYQSTHRLLLTGTPLQNNLEELWALLNFLLPNIFNSSEDFSQWFNKPFESGGDTSPDQALLSEEENLLIINRLHQVLRPFVLRRLKHKVENQLPEKIERLVRCEASAYQKLLMKRVEDNLGSIGNVKGRAVHNSVMELRNICNHPYISQLHAEEVDSLLPKHFLPPIVRLCGKLEMLDRLLPKLKATDHRVLFFSTMTRLLDVMEEYLRWKQYRYLRLDGHTSGGDRGALIDEFNRPDSPVFIFLLSIRAGGVGVNLQAADTVIIFDTDWNPQVDLQAQARAHRIGQKKDVLVLRLETVRSVEEQVRAAAEHKLGVANQSITAGFFDNNTSAEDRREYLESLLRECKKEETAHVLDDDALNDLLARRESEIDVFEGIDKKRHEEEMETWKSLREGPDNGPEPSPPSSSRLVTDDDLKALYAAMQKYDESNAGLKRKNESGLDTQHYGRGKRAREVRSYEDQWTEEEFEKLCQAESPESPKSKEEMDMIASKLDMVNTGQLLPHPSPLALLPTPLVGAVSETLVRSPVALPEVISAATSPQPRPVEAVVPSQSPPRPQPAVVAAISPVPPQTQSGKDLQPPSKRGRGRPKRATNNNLQLPVVLHETSLAATKLEMGSQRAVGMISASGTGSDIYPGPSTVPGPSGMTEPKDGITTASVSVATSVVSTFNQVQGQRKKTQSGSQAPRRRAKKQSTTLNAVGPLVSSMLELPKQTEPALDGSTASAFGHGKQMLVSGPSGTSNICTSISPAGNPFSRIPSATPLAPEKCPVVVAQDKERMASRPSGTSKAPTFVSFEVNPISGLQQMVELVPVRTPIPQFGQEKYANSDFSLEKRETEKVTPVCKEKAVSLQTTGGVHHSVIRTGSEQNVDDLSAPAILPVSQDLVEKRTIQMGSMDLISNPKQDLVENRQLASTENVQKTGVGFVGSDSRPCSSSTAINTAQMGLPRVKPTEVAIRQDSVHIGSTPVVRSQDYKNPKRLIRASARQTRSSLEKDKSKGPTAVKRGSRKKGADVPTTEPPIAGMSNSMMPEVRTTTHAYLGPVEVVEKCNTGKAIIMGEKEEPNVNKAGNVSSIERDTINPDVVPVCNPTVGSEIKQHLDLSLVQKNAAIPIEGTARTKGNENQLSVQSEEKASLEVESIQIPDQVAAVGLAQSDCVKDAALTAEVSFETSTAEHSEKESGATRSNNVHSSQIIHPEKRSGMEPKSTEISNCSERGEQQGYQNDVSVDVKKSPCTASDECKAPFNDAKDEVTVPVVSSLRPIEEVRKDVTSAELVVMSETSTVVTRVPPSENLESATLSSLVSVSPQPNLTTNQVCETPSAKESSAPSHVSESKDLIENFPGHSTIPVVNALIPMTEAKTEPVSTSLENLDDTRNLGHGSTSGPSESNTQLVSESSTVLVSESNIELVPVSIEQTCTASVEDSESNRCISVSGLSKPALDEANDASAADNSLEDRSGTEICNVAMDSKAAGGNNVVNENKVTDFPETAATGSESIGPEVVDKVEVLKKLEGNTSSYDSDRQEHPSPVSINQGSHPVEQIADPLNIPKAVADSAYIPMQGDSNKAGDSAKHEEADQIKAVDQSEVPGSADTPLHPPSTDDPNRGRDSFGPSAIKDPDHIDMVAPTVSPMEDNNEQILRVITGKDEAIDQGPENIEKADNGACLTTIPVIGPTTQDNIVLNSVSSCDDTSQAPTPETADVRKECTNQDLAHPDETDGNRSVPAEPTCGQNDQIQESSVPAEPTCGQNDQIHESSVPAEPTCGQNDQIHETSISASPVSEIP